MEAGRAGFAAFLLADARAELPRPLERFWLERLEDRICQPLGREVFVGDRRRSGAGTRDHRAPEWLVAEKGNNDCGLAERDAGGRRAGAAVMDNARNMLEKPVVWTVAEHKDPIRFT